MADQDETETVAHDETEETEADDSEVEGFSLVVTTRSNIKSSGAMATAPAIGGISGQSGYAIKEQGIK